MTGSAFRLQLAEYIRDAQTLFSVCSEIGDGAHLAGSIFNRPRSTAPREQSSALRRFARLRIIPRERYCQLAFAFTYRPGADSPGG